ncbi:diacylglycerol kinase family protein [Alteromonas oceanisediminis]|uniref:diacylglycerol kinase family protein n=1 Tax=Alteromonas oceanisediminis TaxID=2836180 RepID=UPI001BD9EF24|nr:diacylglycerol kinase family protein [Alteromonas oceanisediminis]MBT0586684.1 dual specificity protein phosphatase family protein [Alteromonas oceanisediminis]
MKMIKYYVGISVLFALFAAYSNNVFMTITCAWVSVSVLAVSLAYVFNRPTIFRKREDGSIPTWIRWFFIPFLLGASLYNAVARKRDKVPPIQEINDHIFLACRLFPSDVDLLKAQGVTAILDVTAEFDGLDWSSQDANLHYLNIPVLDHTSPSVDQLRQAIRWINHQAKAGGKVVIHCALGRGRSVLVTAAYLLSKDATLSIVDAMNHIQSIRTTARLNKHQLKALRKVKKGGRLKLGDKLALIVNPIAGGGKWAHEKDYILERLEQTYDVTVKLTTESISAKTLTKEALDDDVDFIVACGGDGTLAEVADQVCGSSAVMGIIPLGTANALSMVVFGTASKLTPISTACDVIISAQSMTVDTALCNNKRMLLVCALGIEADMIKRSDRGAKDEKGQMAYIQYFLESMFDSATQSLEITLNDDEPFSVESSSFVVANAAPPSTVLAQGGGNPDINDGQLDVTYFDAEKSSLDTVSSVAGLTLSGLLNGRHTELVEFRQCEKIQIKGQQELDYVLDGEVCSAKTIFIQCEPKSLTLLCAPEAIANQQG